MIDFHRLILGDAVRNAAFTEALKRTIRPGESIVADIGSGTGYLSFVASRLGAKQCHLYEQDAGLLRLSKEIARKNGIENCVFHGGHSTAAKKPAQADIVISETLGNYALEENILETLRDARRFLKPRGTMIPQQLTQWIAPIIDGRLHAELNVWSDLRFDFGPAKDVCFSNIYVRTVRPSDLSPDLPPQAWDRIDFRKAEDSVREAELAWKAPNDACIFGFAVWWECELLPDLTLSTAPWAPRTHWEQVYLPLPDPLSLKKGETLQCAIRSDTRYEVKVHVRWEASMVAVSGKRRVRVVGDMAKG